MPSAKPAERASREETAAAPPLDAAFKLVDSLPVPVFFKSRDGRYLGVNRAWEEFFGIPGHAFIGKAVADLYPDDPAIAERHAAMDRELYARPGRQSYEISVRARGGEMRDTIYYKATYTDASGEVAGLIGTIVDITARTRAEAALRGNEERWRSIFNSANEGMLVYDRELKIVAGNQAAERIIGLPLAEIIGAAGFVSLLPCVHADGSPVTPDERPTRLTARSGKPLSGHVIGIKRPGGAHTWLAVNTGFLRHPDAADWYGVVSSFTDITAQRNAEQALRDSEERYRRTFELAGSGLAHVGLDGRFLRVNRRLCEMLGYTEEELGRMTVRDISHPDDREIAPGPRSRVLSGELESVRFEKRYQRKDGGVVWASVAIAMERDRAGQPLYAISVLDDITAQRQAAEALRESETRYRRTFELAGSGVAHIGLDRRFIRVNRRLCEILGYPEDELIGMTGRQISHPDDLDVINTERPRLYAGEIDHLQVEKRYVRKDRSIVWVNFSMVLERDAEGRPMYEIAIFDDVTRRKHAEEDLKRSNAELEQFAYVASHDLQEPLRMVSSYTQLLGRRYGDKLQGDAQEFMDYIVDGAARMKQLIEDLLAYSRVGTKGKEFRPTPLDASLKRAVTNLRAAIEEAGASVTWDPLPTVAIDEVQLAQLFQNLIGNALKFRGPSVPRVHVSAAEQEGDWRITIADNGIGIEPQYFERIFMLFQRLHAMGEYPGTGIGLAICKKVVERHGGTIWVTSAPGEGSQFHFTLPKRESND
ncbi:MAG TPA: PAS domain S-box protein [Burkholderiales bacterium]|nr:PAS domain S-box protein [Burkholderiales bacterium]